MKNRLAASGIALCLAIPLAPPAVASQQESAQDPEPAPLRFEETLTVDARGAFSDHWRVNEQLSDDPEEKMREAMQSRGGRGGGMGRGGSGGGGGRGGAGGGGRGGPGGSGGPEAMMAASAEMIIVHEGSRFSIRTRDGRERVITISDEGIHAAMEEIMPPPRNGNDGDRDNGARGRNGEPPGPMRQRAFWDGPVLVIESQRDEGPGMVERYELVEGARRLVVTRQIQPPMGGEAIEIRTVYDAVGLEN